MRSISLDIRLWTLDIGIKKDAKYRVSTSKV
jgi:hypothetical protein